MAAVSSSKNSFTSISTSKSRRHAVLCRSFKDRLTSLGCPYTDGVDETWISELLFQQGEARLRLLHWLFSRMNPQIAEILEDQYFGSEAKTESRLQKLLKVSSMLGLCHPDDINLISGTASSTKQAVFWDKLLDVLCINDYMEDPNRQDGLLGISSDAGSLEEQFLLDCSYVTALTKGQLSAASADKIGLLPPDLNKLMKRKVKEQEVEKGQSKLSVPSLEALAERLEGMIADLQKEEKRLEEIKSRYTYEESPSQAVSTNCQTFKVVLSELAQLITSFTYTFESEMRPWCKKDPPHLTPLGPAAKRLHTLLSEFKKVLGNLKSIELSYKTITTPSTRETGPHYVLSSNRFFASASDSGIHSCGELMSVLEDSIRVEDYELILEENTGRK